MRAFAGLLISLLAQFAWAASVVAGDAAQAIAGLDDPKTRLQAVSDLWTMGEAALPALRSDLATAPDARAVVVSGLLANQLDLASFDVLLKRVKGADSEATAQRYLDSLLLMVGAAGEAKHWTALHDTALAAKGPAQRKLVDALLALGAETYGTRTGKGRAGVEALAAVIAPSLSSSDAGDVAWALGRRDALRPADLAKALDRALAAKDAGAQSLLDGLLQRADAGEDLAAITGKAEAKARIQKLLQTAIDEVGKDQTRARWAARWGRLLALTIPEAVRAKLGPRLDTTTKGGWKGVYGAKGWFIAGVGKQVDKGGSIEAKGAKDHVWVKQTDDARGLSTGDGKSRIAACLVADKVFTAVVAGAGRVSFYLLDWDRIKRTAAIDRLDAAGKVVETLEVPAYGDGAWACFDVTGPTNFRIRNTGPQNVTVAGIFLD